jgi:ATPase family AAA domain-containing protein 1
MQAAAWYTFQVSYTSPEPQLRFHDRFKWLLNSYVHEGSKEVKAKPMEALKRLGHENLKLDEYESALTYSYSFSLQTSYFSSERIASEVIHPDDIDVTFSGKS